MAPRDAHVTIQSTWQVYLEKVRDFLGRTPNAQLKAEVGLGWDWAYLDPVTKHIILADSCNIKICDQ